MLVVSLPSNVTMAAGLVIGIAAVKKNKLIKLA